MQLIVSAAIIGAVVLWGLIAFLLNFVPAVGSVIAAVPAVALALVDNSPETAAVVTLCYVGINISIGNFLEPRVMGDGMGLAPLIVVASLVFCRPWLTHGGT